MTPEQEEQRRLAERQHDLHHERVKELNKATIETGSQAMRTLIFINGGAAAAVLAFVGALAARDKVQMSAVIGVAKTIVWFAAGVAFAAVGLGASYFVNYCQGAELNSQTLTYTYPYSQAGTSTKRLGRGAVVMQWLAVGFGLAAVGCFVWGMWTVRSAMLGLQ